MTTPAISDYQFLDTKFGRLEYIEAVPLDQTVIGNILFFHGDGRTCDCTDWICPLGPLAQNGFHTRSFSMPGYGKSTGSRKDFRERGSEVISEIITALRLKTAVIAGYSVGGKCVLYAAASDPRITRVVASQPVIPTVSALHSIRQPVMLTWAIDDDGHPYAGPHGFNYIRRELGACCKRTVSWKACDTPGGHAAFYANQYVDEVVAFLSSCRTLKRT
jgi:pimeloyl-ACP methyl ester carboxylesterase